MNDLGSKRNFPKRPHGQDHLSKLPGYYLLNTCLPHLLPHKDKVISIQSAFLKIGSKKLVNSWQIFYLIMKYVYLTVSFNLVIYFVEFITMYVLWRSTSASQPEIIMHYIDHALHDREIIVKVLARPGNSIAMWLLTNGKLETPAPWHATTYIVKFIWFCAESVLGVGGLFNTIFSKRNAKWIHLFFPESRIKVMCWVMSTHMTKGHRTLTLGSRKRKINESILRFFWKRV